MPPILLLFVFFSPAIASPPSSAATESLALLSLHSSVDPDARLHFNTSSHSYAHCHWPGVQCSSILGQWRVTHLVLEGLSLRGLFPYSTLSLLPQLRLLSLKNNSLSGPVGDLSPLTNLKALFLNQNSLSGHFPLSLLLLRRLRTLDLSRNSLSGEIPPSVIFNLSRLYTLRVEFNRFTGRIPPFNLSSLTELNFSYNGFSGAIPATRTLLFLDPSAFSGNPGLCGEPVKTECSNSEFFFFIGSPANAPVQSTPESMTFSSSLGKSKNHRWIAAAAATPVAIFLIGFAVCAAARQRQGKVFRPKKMSTEEEESTLEESTIEESTLPGLCPLVTAQGVGGLVFCGGEEAAFKLEELMRASADMMGKGTAGSTYKAAVTAEMTVSVKRVDAARMTSSGREAFERHMETVGRLRHPNLVPLRAYFQAKEERLLVYEYQPNGSLFSLIHGSKSTRSKAFHWTSCLKIAEDVAQGLAHIHQASRLIHGNLKSSNVLLGDDFEARLVDYCLAPLLDPAPLEGPAAAYRAPEARSPGGTLTAKSDIYAFGVLLMELLAGKSPPAAGEELETWVRSARDDGAAEDERVMMLLSVAAACVRTSPDGRPTAWQVLKMLQEVKEADGEEETDSGLDSGGGS